MQALYKNVMKEHMYLEIVMPDSADHSRQFLHDLSDHAILKASNAPTKLRVVYNASMKTSTGISLNDPAKLGRIFSRTYSTF